jgi:hypothetical protein
LALHTVIVSPTSDHYLSSAPGPPNQYRVEVAIGRAGSGSDLDREGQISLTFWKKSNWTGSGRINLHIVFFHIFDRFRLDWKSFYLGSGRVRSSSNRICLTFKKKSDRIRFGSERVEQVWFFFKKSVWLFY